MSDEGEKSVGWVVIALMLAIAWIGWTFMAASYAHSEEGWRTAGAGAAESFSVRSERRSSLRDFILNGFDQLPDFFSVIKFSFSQRLWLVGIFGGLEVLVILLGWKMKQLETKLSSKPQRRR